MWARLWSWTRWLSEQVVTCPECKVIMSERERRDGRTLCSRCRREVMPGWPYHPDRGRP